MEGSCLPEGARGEVRRCEDAGDGQQMVPGVGQVRPSLGKRECMIGVGQPVNAGVGLSDAGDSKCLQGSSLAFFIGSELNCTDENSKLFRNIWDCMFCGVGNLSKFKLSCKSLFVQCKGFHPLELGVVYMQLLLNLPREATDTNMTGTTPNRRQRDVLPLPLPSVGAIHKLMSFTVVLNGGFRFICHEKLKALPKQQRSKLLSRACSQVWRFNVTAVLNGQFLNWKGPIFSSSSMTTPSQKACIENIEECCNYFCNDPLKSFGPVDFGTLVKQKGIDYSGEEISHALPVRLGEILPGLPDAVVAGSLDAASVASPEVQAWLRDPSKCLLPPERWPNPLPKASMNVRREDWPDIVQALYQRNIVAPNEYDNIFKVNNTPLLNGMFCVLKKGVPAPGETRLCRLIMNLVPSNSVQRLMTTDLDTLASASHWAGCQLPAGSALLWSGDDQKGAFYAWRLPEEWKSLMTFRWPAPGWAVDRPDLKEVWVASKVIPMGWVNSVSLFQHLRRRIGLEKPPLGAGLGKATEMRRDRPIPLSATQETGGWVSYYLDDFDVPEIVPRGMWKSMQGTYSPDHLAQRAAYERSGVRISLDKSHVREPTVERMGAQIDGWLGLLGTPLQKKLECAYFFLWSLRDDVVHHKVILMILGRLVRCFEFRRPLMSVLNKVWPKDRKRVARPFSEKQLHELVYAMCLLPIAICNLRTPVSGLVSCSDASERGGGLCASAGLTEEGERLLKNFLDQGEEDREQVRFRPAGSVEPRRSCGAKILVVSLFDGVAAMLVALARLDCSVVGFASSEIDKSCKRLVRTRWPGVIELGDVTKITSANIEHLAASIGYKLDFVLVGAGSPCQDLSALRAGRKGLEGDKSSLFFEVPRIIKLLKDAFSVPVEFFVENVASMPDADVVTFSEVLETRPVHIDAKYFTHCRRPRLFWASWAVIPQDNEEIVKKPHYDEWIFPDCQKGVDTWLTPGCSWEPGQQALLPTFTRPQRRKKPPYKPAGLETASVEAKQRWTADNFFVQVYNYEKENMIITPDHELRLPTLAEKEKLMGFDEGYISRSFGPKTSASEKELVGGQMIGNTFCVYSVMMLLHECLRKHGLQRQRDHLSLVSISGASPDAWSAYPRFVSGSYTCPSVAQLVSHIMRHAERGGTDVRLDLGAPYRLKAWPRSGVNASLFHWSERENGISRYACSLST